jgi:hypothetical protein
MEWLEQSGRLADRQEGGAVGGHYPS